MPDADGKQNFWTTLPGMLTGLATLLTAATGLYLAIHHGAPADPTPHDASSITAPDTRSTPPAGTIPQNSVAADAPVPNANAHSTVTIHSRKGDTTQLLLKSFRHNSTDDVITLASGQSISFEKIHAIDFLTVNDDAHLVAVNITLLGSRAVTGDLATNYAFTGESDLGPFTIFVQNVRQIVFNR